MDTDGDGIPYLADDEGDDKTPYTPGSPNAEYNDTDADHVPDVFDTMPLDDNWVMVNRFLAGLPCVPQQLKNGLVSLDTGTNTTKLKNFLVLHGASPSNLANFTSNPANYIDINNDQLLSVDELLEGLRKDLNADAANLLTATSFSELEAIMNGMIPKANAAFVVAKMLGIETDVGAALEAFLSTNAENYAIKLVQISAAEELARLSVLEAGAPGDGLVSESDGSLSIVRVHGVSRVTAGIGSALSELAQACSRNEST